MIVKKWPSTDLTNRGPVIILRKEVGTSSGRILLLVHLCSGKKVFANGTGSGPSSLASSRDSSLDRGLDQNKNVPYGGLHSVVSRVCSSPKLTLKQRFQVMRSGSFNDVQGAKSTLEAKRKRWLNRSGSLRLGKTKSYNPNVSANPLQTSPWSSPEADRRGSFPVRDQSLDRGYEDEESGKVKGFVNR